MKNYYVYFAVFISAFVLFSCSDDADPQIKVGNHQTAVDLYLQGNYESLIQPMAQVFGDARSIDELISFSELPENAGESEINLVKLIRNEYPGDISANQRKGSFILNGVKTVLGEPSDPNKRVVNTPASLMDFILENDIEVYAPYLAENFGDSVLRSLTITYYYPGMYGEREDDPLFKGETPGKRYAFNSDGTLDLDGPEPVMTSDEYAMLNPTIVLLPNESLEDIGEVVEEIEEVYQGAKKKQLSGENLFVNTPLCNELSPNNEILTVRMPKVKLRDNIRRWPNPNEMYLWVATGEFSTGGTGTPNINLNTSNPLAGLRISRSDANKKKWVSSNTTFLIQNWKYESQDMHLVWGCTRSQTTLNTEVSVTVKDEEATLQYKVGTVTKGGVELVSSMAYDKCALLYNNRYKVDQNYLFQDNYPIYNFNNIWVYFTFDKINY